MVAVFAREITDDLTSLVKQIDNKVSENSDKKMAAFVVLLSDDPDVDEARLKELAEKEGIEQTPLTIFEGTSGPEDYKIAQEADVTVTMWKKRKVVGSHAFAPGDLTDAAIGVVVADTAKVLE